MSRRSPGRNTLGHKIREAADTRSRQTKETRSHAAVEYQPRKRAKYTSRMFALFDIQAWLRGTASRLHALSARYDLCRVRPGTKCFNPAVTERPADTLRPERL